MTVREMPENNEIPAAPDVAETLHRIEQHLAALRRIQEAASRDWLTIQDVADGLQISRTTVERLIHSGRLQAAEIKSANGTGQRVRFRIRREWIERFLLTNTRSRGQEPLRKPSYRTNKGAVDFIG